MRHLRLSPQSRGAPLEPTVADGAGPALRSENHYDRAQVLPVLKAVWLASDQLCGKLLKAALPQWLAYPEGRTTPLPEALKEKLLQISPAQIDRLLRSSRFEHPK